MKYRVISSVSDLKKYKRKNRYTAKHPNDKQKQQLKRNIRKWRKSMNYVVSAVTTAIKKTRIGTITNSMFGAFGMRAEDADAMIGELVHNSLEDLR